MAPKWFIWVSVFVCSIIGAYVPILWNGSLLSMTSVVFGGIGGIVGVFVSLKVGKSI